MTEPSEEGFFKVIFGREPKKADEPNFDRVVKALKTALDNTTPERPGLVWDKPMREEKDDAPEVI